MVAVLARLTCLACLFCFSTGTLQAHFIPTVGYLDGPTAGTASPATGLARVELEMDLVEMRVFLDFNGLIGNATEANIFIPNPFGAGNVKVNAVLAIPTGVTSGTYDHTFDLVVPESYDPIYMASFGGSVALALEALHDAVEADTAFITLNSNAFAGGEISANLTVVPEPATLSLFGLAAIGVLRRRRSKVARTSGARTEAERLPSASSRPMVGARKPVGK